MRDPLPAISNPWGSSVSSQSKRTSRPRLGGNAVRFVCEDYAPTPIVSPWNGASGFYPTTKCEGMDSILDSELRRFSVYRNVISSIKSWPLMQTSFQTVGGVERFLSDAVAGMREGNRKDELARLIEELKNFAPSAA